MGHLGALGGSFDPSLEDVPLEPAQPELDPASDPLEALCERMVRRFGRAPELASRAPGRVNLIGEHTDYNGGLVLPCAIDRSTTSVAARRDDGRIRIWSANAGEEVEISAAEAAQSTPRSFAHWSDYARCVVAALAERGIAPGGVDLVVASRVPVGAGLSSSAAFTVSLATVLGAAFGARLAPRERADVAHRAESHFLCVGSGILDPYASALGRRDRALRIDCRSREVRPVAAPPGRLALVVADSGVRHALAREGSGYRQRVAECVALVAAAREHGVGAQVRDLRDLSRRDLDRLARAGVEPRLLRRGRHVLEENERVDACCAAMTAGDLAGAGAVLRAGQQSLRDDYEVSTPELDALCEIADALPGVFGSRLTGAGWGGCTIHLVEPEARDVEADIAAGYERRFARRPQVLRVATADGAELLELA